MAESSDIAKVFVETLKLPAEIINIFEDLQTVFAVSAEEILHRLSVHEKSSESAEAIFNTIYEWRSQELEAAILGELGFPVEFLELWKAYDLTVDELSTVTLDELKLVLSTSTTNWNFEEIFRRLLERRSQKGFEILSFEVIECVDDEAEDETEDEAEDEAHGVKEDSNPAIDIKPNSQDGGDNSQSTDEEVPAEPTVNPSNVKPESIPSIQPVPAEKSHEIIETPIREETTCPPAVAINEVDHFNPAFLKKLLNSSLGGEKLLERAQKGPFSEPSQQELAGIIADHHIKHGLITTEKLLESYADAIVCCFIHEFKEDYFVPRKGPKKNPSGKLYNKITNTKQANRDREKAEELFLAKRQRIEDVFQESPAIQEAMDWLLLNRKPWSVVLDKWPETFPKRKELLCNANSQQILLEKFPHYKEPFGFQLIDKDFCMLKAGKPNGLALIEQHLPKLIKFLNRPYSDEKSKQLCETLVAPDASTDTQVTVVLILLNCILRPTKVTVHFKPSVLVAQEEIIIFAVDDEDAKHKLDLFNSMYTRLGLAPIPKLVFLGNDAQSLSGIFQLHYQNIVYSLDSALRAIDVLIKFNTVLGLQHSKISRLVWQFLRTAYYQIPGEAEYSSIIRLRRTLDSQIL